MKPVKTDRHEQARARLEQGINQLRTSDGWQAWLAARKRLHRYSFRNRILIEMQHPGATRIMGFRAWLAFGRCVNKGENAIWIWGPANVKDREGRVDDNGKPRRRLVFLPVAVFDVSQTHEIECENPLPLDPPDRGIHGDADEAALAFSHLANWLCAEGCPVTQEAVPGSAKGFFDTRACRIAVDSGLDDLEALRVLVHEAAHWLGASYDLYGRETAEVMADAVAYVVLDGLGVDCEGSLPYLAGWGSADLDELRAQAEWIDKAAVTLERALDPSSLDPAERKEERAAEPAHA